MRDYKIGVKFLYLQVTLRVPIHNRTLHTFNSYLRNETLLPNMYHFIVGVLCKSGLRVYAADPIKKIVRI